jgi:hypothetical protein
MLLSLNDVEATARFLELRLFDRGVRPRLAQRSLPTDVGSECTMVY